MSAHHMIEPPKQSGWHMIQLKSGQELKAYWNSDEQQWEFGEQDQFYSVTMDKIRTYNVTPIT